MNRRSFLASLGAAAAAPALLQNGLLHATSLSPSEAKAGAQCMAEFAAPPLPSRELYEHDEDAFWAALRGQFLIPTDEVYLNNGTVGSNPYPVLKAVFASFMQTEQMAQEDPEQYPLWGYEADDNYRDALAKFVGARREQIALTRNATESNNYIANGLELAAGDEIIMTDQEHPGGEEPWNLRAKRYGIVVRKVEIPKPPKNAADVLNRISAAITPHTRVIFVSHVSTVTGLVLPAKEIAALARSRNIISAFDGAHATGMMHLDLNDIGCDLYSSSPHKWLQAPKGTGYLFLRDDAVMKKMWNTIATAGWDQPQLAAERFQHIGTASLPLLAGLHGAIEFANWIGMDRIEKRHRALADYIHAQMLQRGAESWTSPDPALRCGIATVTVAPVKMPDLEYALWKQHKVRIRGAAPHKVRLSTPYYLQKADIQRFLEKFDEYRRA